MALRVRCAAAVSVPYRIRRSDRARRIRVSVDGNGEIEVVLPRRSPERHAAEAVQRAGAVDRAAPPRRGAGRAGGRPRRRAPCPTWARSLRLVPEPGRTRVHRRGDALLVPEGDPRPALERWYRRRAKAEIGPRLDAATARAGSRYTGLTIRGQRTRWASCSSTGAMSFNWRLLLAPPEILDYVVEHEVCHLEVMDHSPRFWRLLASRSPRLARALRVAAPLRVDAQRSERSASYGSSPVELAVRNTRPVQAITPPSPRTSSPAAPAGALELDPDRDQVAPARSGGRSPRRASRRREPRT